LASKMSNAARTYKENGGWSLVVCRVHEDIILRRAVAYHVCLVG
jgi:hypothetical protein